METSISEASAVLRSKVPANVQAMIKERFSGSQRRDLSEIACTCGAGDAAPIDGHKKMCARAQAVYRREYYARKKETGAAEHKAATPEAVAEAARNLGHLASGVPKKRRPGAAVGGRPEVPLSEIACTCGLGDSQPDAMKHPFPCRRRATAYKRAERSGELPKRARRVPSASESAG